MQLVVPIELRDVRAVALEALAVLQVVPVPVRFRERVRDHDQLRVRPARLADVPIFICPESKIRRREDTLKGRGRADADLPRRDASLRQPEKDFDTLYFKELFCPVVSPDLSLCVST